MHLRQTTAFCAPSHTPGYKMNLKFLTSICSNYHALPEWKQFSIEIDSKSFASFEENLIPSVAIPEP